MTLFLIRMYLPRLKWVSGLGTGRSVREYGRGDAALIYLLVDFLFRLLRARLKYLISVLVAAELGIHMPACAGASLEKLAAMATLADFRIAGKFLAELQPKGSKECLRCNSQPQASFRILRQHSPILIPDCTRAMMQNGMQAFADSSDGTAEAHGRLSPAANRWKRTRPMRYLLAALGSQILL